MCNTSSGVRSTNHSREIRYISPRSCYIQSTGHCYKITLYRTHILYYVITQHVCTEYLCPSSYPPTLVHNLTYIRLKTQVVRTVAAGFFIYLHVTSTIITFESNTLHPRTLKKSAQKYRQLSTTSELRIPSKLQSDFRVCDDILRSSADCPG